MLSVILQKATGMTAYDFGKKYLFEPLGMESVKCELDPQWYSDGGNGFSMNVYDIDTFGSQKYDAYFAQGHWGQFIFVIPEINLMVVFTSHHEGSTNMYWNFVNEVVSAYEG